MRFGPVVAVALTGVGAAAVAVMATAPGTEQAAGWQVLLVAAATSPPIALGLLLAARRPRLAIGPLLVALGVAPLAVFALASWAGTATAAHPWPGAHAAAVLNAGSWMWFYLPAALILAVFPDGRLPSRRWRWVLLGWPVVLVAFHTGVALDPGTYTTGGGAVSGAPPGHLPAATAFVLGFPALAGMLALLVGSAAAMRSRYRHGDADVRRRIRWLTLPAFVLPLLLPVCWVSILATGDATAAVVAGLVVVFVAMPVGIVIAILRHDLYDIDRLLSRTVSYSIITLLLTALFAAVVVTAGLVVGQDSPPTVALATLACAVAFGWLRRRVQAVVDRRFDRDHSRAVAEIARFVEAVRDGKAAPEQLETAMRAALVDPVLRVAYALPAADGEVSWLDGAGTPVERPAEPYHLLAAEGRPLAVIGYGSRTAARPGLLLDVLREAHLPLEVARSRIEVRAALADSEASRARLVRAGYEERRRLERDLHDGAQQRLVGIGMSLRLAQRHLPPGDPTNALLENAIAEMRDAVGELRRISQGVRPSGLDDGLPSALRTLVRSSPVPVELRVTPDQVHDTVATTAYYVAAEAVANALKHASPRRVRVDVSHVDGLLHVSVVDDGRGGAVVVPGSGLAGLTDRVSAGGGTLRVHSEPGRGTTVEAMLPCAS